LTLYSVPDLRILLSIKQKLGKFIGFLVYMFKNVINKEEDMNWHE